MDLTFMATPTRIGKTSDSNTFTLVTIVKTAAMIDRFLHEIPQASKRAKREQAPLLILVFP